MYIKQWHVQLILLALVSKAKLKLQGKALTFYVICTLYILYVLCTLLLGFNAHINSWVSFHYPLR